MPKRIPQWLVQCGAKRQYESYKQANGCAKCLRKRTGACIVAYHCAYCDYWHVGHVPRRAGGTIVASDDQT